MQSASRSSHFEFEWCSQASHVHDDWFAGQECRHHVFLQLQQVKQWCCERGEGHAGLSTLRGGGRGGGGSVGSTPVTTSEQLQ